MYLGRCCRGRRSAFMQMVFLILHLTVRPQAVSESIAFVNESPSGLWSEMLESLYVVTTHLAAAIALPPRICSCSIASCHHIMISFWSLDLPITIPWLCNMDMSFPSWNRGSSTNINFEKRGTQKQAISIDATIFKFLHSLSRDIANW